MNQFLKLHLHLIICSLFVFIGCTNPKTSRVFVHTMEDGARVNIKIEYKPNSQITGDKKVGSYYYMVQYFTPKPPSSAKPKSIKKEFLNISFYDRKGYLLVKYFQPHIIVSGGNINQYEKNKIDGGWEWKGRFDESFITLENFQNIHSIKVK